MPQKQKDRPPHLRPFVLSSNSTSSLRVLQKIVTPNSQLNTVKTASRPLPDAAVQVKLPPVSQQEDADLRLPEVKSWFPESRWDFRGGRKENVGHGHAHRWSMDIWKKIAPYLGNDTMAGKIGVEEYMLEVLSH